MRPKTVWLKADTIYALEKWAAKQTLEKGQHIYFNTVVNEILDAKARDVA